MMGKGASTWQMQVGSGTWQMQVGSSAYQMQVGGLHVAGGSWRAGTFVSVDELGGVDLE